MHFFEREKILTPSGLARLSQVDKSRRIADINNLLNYSDDAYQVAEQLIYDHTLPEYLNDDNLEIIENVLDAVSAEKILIVHSLLAPIIYVEFAEGHYGKVEYSMGGLVTTLVVESERSDFAYIHKDPFPGVLFNTQNYISMQNVPKNSDKWVQAKNEFIEAILEASNAYNFTTKDEKEKFVSQDYLNNRLCEVMI